MKKQLNFIQNLNPKYNYIVHGVDNTKVIGSIPRECMNW